jgi:predicted Fe-Mo cluster-binding NifX family protein
MKICISSKGKDLNSMVDPRFGRCSYFIIVDIDTLNFESIGNDSMMASGGAGIRAAQTVAKTGVEAVITGNIGPNAFHTLSAAGIMVYTGANGIIRGIIERYKKGDFMKTESANVDSHFGMKSS